MGDAYIDRDAERFIRAIGYALNELGAKSLDRYTLTHFTPSIKIGRRYLDVYDSVTDRHYSIEINAIERKEV